ncbi:MAG: DUF2336 domain-containing protein [Parvibaculaceae bacterium]
MIDSAAPDPAEAVAAEQGGHREEPGRHAASGDTDAASPAGRRGTAASFRDLTAKLKARPAPRPAAPAAVPPPPEPLEPPTAFLQEPAAPAEETALPESALEISQEPAAEEAVQPPLEMLQEPEVPEAAVPDADASSAEEEEPSLPFPPDPITDEQVWPAEEALQIAEEAYEPEISEQPSEPADETDLFLQTFSDAPSEDALAPKEGPLSLLDTDFAQLMNAFLSGDDAPERKAPQSETPATIHEEAEDGEDGIEAAILKPLGKEAGPEASKRETDILAEGDAEVAPGVQEEDAFAAPLAEVYEPTEAEAYAKAAPEAIEDVSPADEAFPADDVSSTDVEEPAREMPLAFDLPRLEDFEDAADATPPDLEQAGMDAEPGAPAEAAEAEAGASEFAQSHENGAEEVEDIEEPDPVPESDPEIAQEPAPLEEAAPLEPHQLAEDFSEAVEEPTTLLAEVDDPLPIEASAAQETAEEAVAPEEDAPIDTPQPTEESFEVAEEPAASPAEVDAPLQVEASTMPETAENPAAEASEAPEIPPVVMRPDPKSAETARMLLDIMSMPSGASQPQERALAADTLLRLVDRMPEAALIGLAERLSIMDVPPQLLVKRLIVHPNADVAGPLLENCNAITDRDLIEIASAAAPARLKTIARRRHISSALADALIRRDDTALSLTLIRNQNALLSHDAFRELAERAKSHPSLQAPLATRADTPTPVAFELFWFLPMELRRYVLSRFLTDSATLERILKLARSVEEGTRPSEARRAGQAELDELVALIGTGRRDEAARLMASLADICEPCALRVIGDSEGEPQTVVLKALGLSRKRFSETIDAWRSSPDVAISAERDTTDLKALFDTLSFNKARVLLTYWDWAARRSGPYARQAA